MLIFFKADHDSHRTQHLQEEMLQVLPHEEVEIHDRTTLSGRLRRRIYDVDMVVCIASDLDALCEIEHIREISQHLELVLVVSGQVAAQTARLYRLYPRSVLRMDEETPWVVEFVCNKMKNLKKGRHENV